MTDYSSGVDAAPADRPGHSPQFGVRVIIKGEEAPRIATSFASPHGSWFEQNLVSTNGYRMSFDAEDHFRWEASDGCGYASIADDRYYFGGDLPRTVAAEISDVLTGTRGTPVALMLNCFDNEIDDYLNDEDDNPIKVPVYLVPEFISDSDSAGDSAQTVPAGRSPANVKRRTVPTRAQRKKAAKSIGRKR